MTERETSYFFYYLEFNSISVFFIERNQGWQLDILPLQLQETH